MPVSPVARGDMLLTTQSSAETFSTDRTLVDFVLSSPDRNLLGIPVSRENSRELRIGEASAKASETKRKEFLTAYQIERDARITFIPFAVGRSGLLGADAQDLIKLITKVLDVHEASAFSRHGTRRNLVEIVSTTIHAWVGAKRLRAIDGHRANLQEMHRRLAMAQAGSSRGASVPLLVGGGATLTSALVSVTGAAGAGSVGETSQGSGRATD